MVMMADDWNQIRALLYKEYLIHKKNMVTTFVVEIGLPLLMAFSFFIIFPSAIDYRLRQLTDHQIALDKTQVSLADQLNDFRDRFEKNRTLFYAPKNKMSTKIMGIADQILRVLNLSFSTEPFNTVESMEERLDEIFDPKRGEYFRRPIAAIVFRKEEQYPKNFSYVIRPTHLREPNQLYVNMDASSGSFETGAKQLIPPGYVTSGFIYIQCLINTAMLLEQWNTTFLSPMPGQPSLLEFQDLFNLSSYNALLPAVVPLRQADSSLLLDPILMTPGLLYAVSYMISFMPMLVFIKRILDEKCSKMTELLKLMSMKERNYWISKWLIHGAYFFVINIVITMLFAYSAKGRINLLIYYLFNVLYSTSTMFLASALTVFFVKPVAGIGAYVAIQVLNGRPTWRFLEKPGLADTRIYQGEISLPDIVHLVLAILLGPNYGAMHFLYLLYEAGAYSYSASLVPRYGAYRSSWANLFRVPPKYTFLSLGTLLIAIFLSGLLWLVCLWYFRQVWPSEESGAKPFYFPIQPIIQKFQSKVSGKISPGIKNNEYFEADPSKLDLKLFINNVTKRFGKKMAVKNLTLKVYAGQITVLLGHNGAGKTTLIQMITGLIPPTEGQIYVGGVDVQKDIAAARKHIGYCPQHTILYNDLTVEEHLWFFGSLKGFSRSEMRIEINRVLNLLELVDKRSTFSKNLSGGMKKKLQMAGAIMGTSNVLILDEPSSGLDIEARRMIWDILISLRKSYLVLLTTHHMEEADCLGDRIAIMHGGQLKSCGSAAFLKQAFDVGYSMTVLKARESTQIAEFLRNFLGSFSVENETSNEIVFNIPPSEKKKLPFTLEQLENNLKEIGGITFGMRGHSIDSVFLKAITLFNEIETSNSPELKDLYHGTDYSGLEWQRFVALLRCRFNGLKRSTPTILLLIVLSLLSTVGAFIMVTFQLEKVPPTIEAWSQELNADQLNYEGLKGFCTNSDVVDDFCDKFVETATSSKFDIDITTTEPEKYTEELLNKNYELYMNEILIGGSLRNYSIRSILFNTSFLNNSFSIVRKFLSELPRFDMLPVAWYNAKAFHSSPLSLNIMYTKLLHELTPNGNIELGVHTFPYENQYVAMDKLRRIVFDTYTAVMILMFGFIFTVPYPSVYLTKERISKAKYLLEMSGVKFWWYWSSNFVFDLVIMLIMFIPFYVVIATTPLVFGRNVLFSNWTLLLIFIITFLGFILSSLVLTYVFSMIFTQASTVYAVIVIPSCIAVAVLNNMIVLLQMMPQDDDTAGYNWYEWLFIHILLVFCHICPYWLFTDVAVKVLRTTNSIYLCKKYNKEDLQVLCEFNLAFIKVCCQNRCANECYNEWYEPFAFGESGILLNLLLLFSMFFGYTLLLWLIETRRTKRSISSLFTTNTKDPLSEDSDVKAERERVTEIVKQSRTAGETFIAHNLTKMFKKTVAVDRVSFGLKRRECFGLLGFNGAGKTTTFRMIVGEIFPTTGTSFVGRLSLDKDFRGYVRQIGYCPQFDPMFHCLTGVETLQLFATVRGVPKHEIKGAIDQMICLVDLEKYANIVVDNYSGGNKRKLSLAIALIGTPHIVLLDEPSAGVDPVARRKLWSAIDLFRNTTSGSILFSSHTMDECEALCDKLVIMKKGRLQCLGSPQYLKIKFSKGYTLFVKLAPDEIFEAFDICLKTVFPSAVFKDMHQKAVTYDVTDPQTAISYVFKKMEELESRFKIEDYTVSNTSLEDIFLSFNKNA